jgi:ethanolamine ammonia-lyase small subunit
MNKELIETIAKLVLEQIREASVEKAAITESKASSSGMVKLWDHLSSTPQFVETGMKQQADSVPAQNHEKPVKLWDHVGNSKESIPRCSMNNEDLILPELQTRIGVSSPNKPDALQEWVNKTPARVGVGRAGLRPKTETWLRFRLDHGAAVDAVYGTVPEKLLESLKLFSVSTMVEHKEEYIRRPDLGRKLSEEAKIKISEKCQLKPCVQIIASDGLSSQAIEKNLEDVYLSFLQSLDHLGIEYGTPFYIEKGRVASMDEVGEILQPEVVVLFIGERPGLVSSESLSAYLCFKPRIGTIEADRMVISNIHTGGIPPVEAGAYLGSVVQKILKYQASGVSLVRKES